MANTLTEVIPKLLAQGLRALRENSITARLVNSRFERQAAERGSTIDVPVPSAITAVEVAPANVPPATADVAPTSVPIALDQWWEAPFHLSDQEQLEVMEGTIPMQASEAIKGIINKVDQDILSKYVEFYGYHGTAGTTPFSSGDTADVTKVRALMDKQLVPVNDVDRHFILDPDANAQALDIRAFQDMSWSGSFDAIREGRLNQRLGFSFWMNQNLPTHVAGTLDGDGTKGGLINDASVTIGQKTVDIDATALTGTVVKGDIFTVAGDTQTYVITADGTASGNALTIAFEPGAKVAWADNAQLTIKDTHVVNLAMHRDAIGFATRPLAGTTSGLPVLIQSAADPISGLTLRIEVSREHKRTRFSYDVLWGAKVVRPEFGVRLAG